ncbi:intraflagellar transport protein 122 homolog [Galendromus occidentalis]|uniref:Intraflagellar transport protein 122 homolog n=1 Tax=Galendromus occidentalis TaxID=34638 RepID=A0AAJ6QPF7_9ACAR|nr:intraflagellar transport protein 122 homolog [Galendromus occidentalis]
MRTSVLWQDSVKDTENNEQVIYDVCFEPGGKRLIVAAGNRVLVYDTETGQHVDALKGHKDFVYCLSYASDGQRFASGGADKMVIIWTPQLEGILKYSHTDSLQCLAHNPVTHQLLSCASGDFGIWSWEQKSVTKHRVTSRITSCSWKQDGSCFAIGLASGIVSVRTRAGDEVLKIERPSEVWGVAFCPPADDEFDLAIADWTQTLSFYTLNGRMVTKERPLGFDTLFMKYFGNNFLVLGGSNNALSVLSREGVHLGGPLCEQKGWIWCCDVIPDKDTHNVAIGSNDGTIALVQLGLATVHSLYRERYAFRENMTHVVIQHMVTGEKVRIKCRDVVRKLAIYKDNLAVQLAERVIIYEQAEAMHYKVKKKLNMKVECSLLVICSDNLVLCQDRILQSLNLDGNVERQWTMSAPIRYIKTIGGARSREGLLVGCKDGSVVLVYLNNSVALQVLNKQSLGVRCLDCTAYRDRIATVDDSGDLRVYNRKDSKKTAIFEVKDSAASVACSTQLQDLYSYSGNQNLCVRLAANNSASSLAFEGFVVGLSGNNAFCLQYNTMITFRLALGVAIDSALKESVQTAYEMCCLGVSKTNWKKLQEVASKSDNFHVLRKIAQRTRNYSACLILKAAESETDIAMQKFLITSRLLKQYVEASRIEGTSAQLQDAIDAMASDLNILDRARSSKNRSAILRRAQWAQRMNDSKNAVELFLAAGDTVSAIKILARNDQQDRIWNILKDLDASKDREQLLLCAQYLKSIDQVKLCVRIFEQLSDEDLLLEVYCDTALWDKALEIARRRGDDVEKGVHFKRANWLAEDDKFIEAQLAFQNAGRPKEALRVLEQLLDNAVDEERFTDVSWYYFQIAQHLGSQEKFNEAEYDKLMKMARVFFAYSFIYRYIVDPFTVHPAHTLFFISRYLVNEEATLNSIDSVSRCNVLIALTKQCTAMGAFKVARTIYTKLQNLLQPRNNELRQSVAIHSIISRSKAFADAEETELPCYACSSMNPALAKNNQCLQCGQPFIFSMITFEVLPVVPLKDVTMGDDDFTAALSAGKLFRDAEYRVVQTGGHQLSPRAVIVVPREGKRKPDYYLNVMPNVPVCYCRGCYNLFASDDFEMSTLQYGHCPFCRTPSDSSATEVSS